MARNLWGDPQRYRETYFSTYPGYYFTGDGAKCDSQGRWRITGRVDDVINVSGHRIATAEVEEAINEHPHIVESAVVGFPHPIKGQGILAYVTLPQEACPNKGSDISQWEAQLREEINRLVGQSIGAIARPDSIQIVSGLPKTRSGKIMRRILRKIANRQTSQLGDTSTLLNPEIVQEIAQKTEHILNEAH